MPGYAGVLPRVFPYRYRTDAESAAAAINVLLGEGFTNFALTSHPSTVDGHVDLWLSTENAQFLTNMGVIGSRNLEET